MKDGLLTWTTAAETNSSRFEVLRSADGRTFGVVGQVEAAGSSSSPRHYRFLDRQLPAALLYYRLRQLDLDGTATLSSVIALRGTGPAAGLVAYPNPVHNVLTLRLSGPEPTAGTRIQVLDLRGRVVLNQPWPTTGQLDLSALPAGTYLLRVAGTGAPLITRVVKQ